MEFESVKPGIGYKNKRGHRTSFHFDDTYINFLLPIVLPKSTSEKHGQLELYANLRDFKLGVRDRFVVPFLRDIGFYKNFHTPKQVTYQEGGLYCFYGFRSLHGVAPLDEDVERIVCNWAFRLRRK